MEAAASTSRTATAPPAQQAGVSVPEAVGRRRLVFLVTFVLLGFGLVMVASASSGTTLLQGYGEWVFLQRQATFAAIGLVGMAAAATVPLALVRRLTMVVFGLSIGLLFLVMVPGLGETVNGATRWIRIGAFQLQPSEVAKFASLLLVADHLARTPAPRHWLHDFVRSPGGLAIATAGLIFLQRDLGSAFLLSVTVVTLYMLAGTSRRLLAGTVGTGAALVAIGILSEPFRRERFLAFVDPWADPTGPGYQLVQSLIAIGSGGPFGVGLGHSVQKIHFLPEAHTDMIFAITVEELGVIGMIVILGSFLVLAVVGLRIAMRARTRYAALLAAGLTTMVVGQAVVNVGGVTGIMPLTGIPLPLVSYGGTSLVMTLVSLGLLANVAVEQRPRRRVILSRGRAAGDDQPGSGRGAPAGARGGGRHGRAPGADARGG